ncbi:hypothetical protein F5141DRAFT_1217110 [Pisolithus sp. B1]|nr:hypothetical protein F5141DRAFT_1217110 [Pisolithus sp. B1]
MVTVFHLFKAYSNPITINAETGRPAKGSAPPWTTHQSPKQAPPNTSAPPSPKTLGTNPPTTCLLAAEVKELWAELATLKEKFYKYITSHKACCQHSNSHSEASEEAPSDNNGQPSPPPPPPAFNLLIQRPDGAMVPNDNPPSWLPTVLNCLDPPPTFLGSLYTPDPPPMKDSPPCGTVEVLKLHFCGSRPFYLVVCPDRSLHIISSAEHSEVSTFFKFPPDPTVPTACP